MNVADCYRLLGLTSEASLADIKASYRRLARQYHPDAYSGDARLAKQAQEKFMQLTEAYQLLLKVVPSGKPRQPRNGESRVPRQPPAPVNYPSQGAEPPPPQSERRVRVTRKAPSPQPPVSADEDQLKQRAYRQLQDLLKFKRFAQAVALTEGLGQRFPQDLEIRQWQAITYQQWGRQLITEGKLDKARTYLKKALRTDPHNRSLWKEVERDFRRLEQVF